MSFGGGAFAVATVFFTVTSFGTRLVNGDAFTVAATYREV